MMGIDFLPTIWEWAGGAADELPGDVDGDGKTNSDEFQVASDPLVAD